MSVMDEVAPIAEEISKEITGMEYFELRFLLQNEKKYADVIRDLFRQANIVRYYRLGRNPSRWLTNTEELKKLKDIAERGV
jgi:hypothetical protein